jgi:predicted esterase/tetratricopeptide (TPR) repeat protein
VRIGSELIKRLGRARSSVFLACIFCWAGTLIPAERISATEVVLKDGRALRGKVGMVSGLAELPQPLGPDGESPTLSILLMDDDLCRTFVSKRQLKEVRQEQSDQSEEKFRIVQRVMRNGQVVHSVGPAMRLQPFDEFGRRIFTMYTAKGPVNVIQGITELTPRWTKVEGISHVWDMRIATNSIPRETLQKILLRQLNPQDAESYKKIARFYLQAERYRDARQTLDDLLAAFPDRKDLQEQLAPSLRAIKRMSAQQLLSELKLRQGAGQHALVWDGLKKFPSDDVGGDILQAAGDMLKDYETRIARRNKVLEKIDALLPRISDEYQREQVWKIRDELAAELSLNTMDRMAAFLQNADDAQMPVQEKLALAISGWLLGSDSAVDQLPVALSIYGARRQVREYLVEQTKGKREAILDGLRSQEGSSPVLIADLLSHMKPPADPPKGVSPSKPGYYKLEAPGLPREKPFTYWVQLPPEYDPYKLYPAIITLNGAGNTAESQIDWWAGDWVNVRQASEKGEDAANPPAPDGQMPDVKQPDEKKTDDETTGEKKPDEKRPDDKTTGEKKPAAETPAIPMYRNGHASRFGYIVIAPQWTGEHQNKYNYSAREHAAVLNSLRDACRRFSIDTDRVFLSGYSTGGDAAWDIALAHPDLWAGAIPISALADRYCTFYWENAKYVPFYVILGELDGTKITKNALDLDRYLKYGYNATAVEYQGRGHDDFHEDILHIFDWMGRFRRNFFPREFICATMRDWDNFFWWVELDDMPPKTQVDPGHWPPPAGTRPAQVKGKIVNNNINVTAGGSQVSVWVSPQMVDFKQRVNVTVNGQQINTKEPFLQGDLRTILEDARTRADRQHPFWTRLDNSTGRTRGK